MMRFLRSPWLAVLMLLASPAGAGLVLPVLHPCPVQMASEGPMDGHHHGHSGHGDQDGSGQPTCTCVGSCHVPVVVDPGQPAPVRSRIVTAAWTPPSVSPHTASTGVRQPLDFLPPITAPPRH
jgi:hypothetical protein